MSELVLNSFQQSTISQTFKKLGHDIPVSGIVPSRPPSTTEILVTPSRNTMPAGDISAGSQFVLDVPRLGHLAMAIVEFVYTQTTSDTWAIQTKNGPIGLSLAQNISLQTANRTLYDQQDLASIGRVQHSQVGKSVWLTSIAEKIVRSTFVPSFNSTVECVSYCMIHAPFFEDERNYYDASRNESLRVVVTMNSKQRAGIPNTVAFSQIACNLYTWHVKYDSETEKMLVEANRKPSIPLQMLGYSHFYETLAVTGTPTSASIIINSDVPAVRTYVRIRDTTAAFYEAPFVNHTAFTHFKVKVNGQEYQAQVPKLIGQSWGMTKGEAGLLSVSSTNSALYSVQRMSNSVLCINWGHDVVDHTYSSGFLPLVALNRAEITLYTSSAMSTANEIEYCHEYLVMYSQDASNGQLMIYTSS